MKSEKSLMVETNNQVSLFPWYFRFLYSRIPIKKWYTTEYYPYDVPLYDCILIKVLATPFRLVLTNPDWTPC